MIDDKKGDIYEDAMIQSNTSDLLSKIKKFLIKQWNGD